MRHHNEITAEFPILNSVKLKRKIKNCYIFCWVWLCMPLILAVWRQRQVDLGEFEGNLAAQ